MTGGGGDSECVLQLNAGQASGLRFTLCCVLPDRALQVLPVLGSPSPSAFSLKFMAGAWTCGFSIITGGGASLVTTAPIPCNRCRCKALTPPFMLRSIQIKIKNGDYKVVTACLPCFRLVIPAWMTAPSHFSMLELVFFPEIRVQSIVVSRRTTTTATTEKLALQSKSLWKLLKYLITTGVRWHWASMRLPLALGYLVLFLIVAYFSLSSSHGLMRLFNFSGICIVWTEVCRERLKKGQAGQSRRFQSGQLFFNVTTKQMAEVRMGYLFLFVFGTITCVFVICWIPHSWSHHCWESRGSCWSEMRIR